MRQETTDGRGLPAELDGGELVIPTTYTVHQEKGATFRNYLRRVGKEEMMGEKNQEVRKVSA